MKDEKRHKKRPRVRNCSGLKGHELLLRRSEQHIHSARHCSLHCRTVGKCIRGIADAPQWRLRRQRRQRQRSADGFVQRSGPCALSGYSLQL